MKYFINILLIALYFIPWSTQAQMTTSDQRVSVSGLYDQNTVKLRWAPTDRVTWRKLNDCGITITRTTLKANGEDLKQQQRLQSQVVLISNLKPLTDNEFQAAVSSDEGTLVRKALYSDEMDIPVSDPPKLLDAKNYMEREEMKFIFSIVAVEQDFEVAKAAAWAYEDLSTSPNHTYAYTVAPSTVDTSYLIDIGATQVSTTPGGSFPAITDLVATPEVEKIDLTWDNPTECKFTSFKILRSTDGNNFSDLTQRPFIYMANSEELSDIVYSDNTAILGTTYFYKVIGLTPFATESAESTIVSASPLYPRIEGQIISYADDIPTDDDVTLLWDMDPSYNNQISHFNVYRSAHSVDGYEVINSTTIKSNERTYEDKAPLDDAYYYIEALDMNNNSYITRKFMVMLPDTIPPAAPTGVTGTYVSSSEIILTWDKNTESDLDGYKVYASNQKEGTYIQLNARALQGTRFTHHTDPQVIGDSIYIKVIAQDTRENYSEYSAPFAVKRYDDVPPSPPLLSRIFPSADGIELSWEYSASTDVTQHYIERKATGTPTWERVLTIEKKEQDDYCQGSNDPTVCFVDSIGLQNREYQYRMVAQGEDYQLGGSEPLLVTPTVAAVSGDISNVEMEQTEEDLPTNNLVEEQITNLIEQGNNQFKSSSSGAVRKNIDLTWVYELDPNVHDFQIFRTTTAGSPVLYKTLKLAKVLGFDEDQEVNVEISQGPTSFNWSDDDLTTGVRYTYQIMARHKDGSTSNRSMVVSKKIN